MLYAISVPATDFDPSLEMPVNSGAFYEQPPDRLRVDAQHRGPAPSSITARSGID
jgi:hypothetical protein